MSQTIDGVYRDFKTAGVPTSGEHEPPKPEIRALLKQIQNSSGMSVTRNTKAALEGINPPNENYMGVVLTGEGAGYYSRVGGAWVFGRGFSDTLARLEVVGGTPNAIIAEAATGVAPGDVGAFIIDITEANTAAVKISINGGPYISVLSVDGDDYEPGEFTGRLMLENLDTELLALTADPGVIAALVEEATSVAPGTWQLLRDETVEARDLARGARDEAVPAALVASSQADRSTVAADRAELASDAAAAGGIVYPDIATGRAATLDTKFFKVLGSGDVSFRLYQRTSSVSQTLAMEQPSAQALASRGLTDGYRDPTKLAVFFDQLGNIFGSVSTATASWDIKLKKLALESGLGMELYEVHSPETGESPPFYLVDDNFQIIWQPVPTAVASEVTAARGSRASLGERISQFLLPSGQPQLAEMNRHLLRQCHQRLTSLVLGATQQLNLALGGPGDSYSANYLRYTTSIATILIARYGDGGGGWTGYGYASAYNGPFVIGGLQPGNSNGNVRPVLYPVRYSGTWAGVYNNSPSPDLAHVVSSTPGDRIQRTVPATPAHTALRLLWIGTAEGVIQWRVNAGAFTVLNVQGALDSIQSADLPIGATAWGAGVNYASGALVTSGGTIYTAQTAHTSGASFAADLALNRWVASPITVQIDVVSGTVKLCGDNALSDANGVRVHKLAGSGSAVAQWVAQNAAQQQAGWARLGLHAVMMMDGPNSQGAAQPPVAWKADMGTMIDRIRAAVPFPDICIFMPPENGRLANAYPMAEYAKAARELAVSKGTAFRDLQGDFGLLPEDYASTSGYPLFNPDRLHPEPISGGPLMVAAELDMIIPF